jgi:hypothetical protein
MAFAVTDWRRDAYADAYADPYSADDHLLAPTDVAVARYVDREIAEAGALATLCATVAALARERPLVAGVLRTFAMELDEEAASLAAMAFDDVRWPLREPLHSDPEDLDASLETVANALRHSEHVLGWIVKRPDLPAWATTTFAALTSARRARRMLLHVCDELDAYPRDLAA